MAAPADILDDIKADLGIPPEDTASDAWLQRRIDGVWSRMEVYTDRRLCSPPAVFTDDWSRIAEAARYDIVPPSWFYSPTATVFLRNFPVTAIDAVEIDGGSGVAADVAFAPKTGKLFGLRAGESPSDLCRMLAPARVKVTYRAGWAVIPADLYEVVLGALQASWADRQRQSAGLGGATEISIQDVGSVSLGTTTNAFLEGTMKGAGAVSDPLLGPYTNMLQHYIDHRSRIGWAYMPVTTEVITP